MNRSATFRYSPRTAPAGGLERDAVHAQRRSGSRCYGSRTCSLSIRDVAVRTPL